MIRFLSSATNFGASEHSWQRIVNVLWVAQFVTMIGMNACLPFLPLYVRELGITELAVAQRWTGYVYAGPFLLSIITVPIWGALGDRYGKKLMILRAIFGLTIAMFLMGFVQNVWQLFVLRVIQGAVSGFVAASLSLISAIAPEHKRGYAISLLQTSISAGTVIGPLLGGVLSDAFGVRSLFIVVAVCCLISGIIVIVFVPEHKQSSTSAASYPILNHLHFAVREPLLRQLLLMIIVMQAAINFTVPIMAYYLESLGAPQQILATITGISVGIVGVLTVVFAPRWGRHTDKRGFVSTLLRILPLLGLATALQAAIPQYMYIFPLRMAIGVFSGAAIPVLYTALSKHAPSERTGGIMGLASSATLLGGLISPIVSGWVASHWGMRWCFVVSGLLFVAMYPTIYSLHVQTK